jgi:hypothetical protein
MRRVTFSLVPLLLLACERQPAAPDITPTLGIANAPAQSGIVLRAETQEAWIWSDLKAGLQLDLAFDPVAACTGNFAADWVSFQAASLPNGRLTFREAGPVQASVWGFVEFDCSRFLTEEPLATGEVNYRSTDNDYFGAGDHSVNSWGLMANGKLTRPDGGSANLSAHIRVVDDRPVSVQINLR